MPAVDLNCDLGEGVGDDAALFPLITSVNVACGFHAGDQASMREACRAALAFGITVGAHPSYRDRQGFGRRDLDVSAAQLEAEVREQVQALRRAADAEGATISYLKPHGALYNRLVVDDERAEAVAAAAAAEGLSLLGPAGSALARAADRRRLGFFREAFADRAYLADGRLAPRSLPGAVITDPAVVAARAVRMVLEGEVATVDGGVRRIEADSICLHGDTEGAPAIARAVRTALRSAGVVLSPFR
ncbi:MAG: hypothetical protein JWR33_2444 [Naasia sp.]|uniref:LamB/YcsF family protein n=1 Tax=Naasia sp. TaxID=2546198 RepID=UPI0026391C10|nr:5-oxoprolinase subunit PxpA [Naasia sp.]MCU1571703.1 hypothetical protein [Naasia sp.]